MRKRSPPFDPHVFLAKVGNGKTLLHVRKKGVIFAQGEAADAVFYLQTGRVKLTVVSARGKEAIVAMLDRASFLVKAVSSLGNLCAWPPPPP